MDGQQFAHAEPRREHAVDELAPLVFHISHQGLLGTG
jgi:hypothetical protein